MVAAEYAKQRRGLTKLIRLARKVAMEAVAKPVKRIAKSAGDALTAAKEHIGAEAKPAAKRGHPAKPKVDASVSAEANRADRQ
jgi:hypothetical protein